MEDKIGGLLQDSGTLLEICGSAFEDIFQYQLFVRCLPEQTFVENGVRRMRKKEDGGLSFTALQDPSNPDTMYRVKKLENLPWLCCECDRIHWKQGKRSDELAV